MLSWFKKKFSTSTTTTAASAAGDTEEMAAAPPAAPDSDTGLVTEESAATAAEPLATAAVSPDSPELPTDETADDASPADSGTELAEETAAAQPAESAAKKSGFFSRLADKLTRTRESFTNQLDNLFYGKKEIDKQLLDDLEEILITADLGFATTQEILDHARQKVKRQELDNPAALKDALKKQICTYLADTQQDAALVMPERGPFVIMVIGVNGVGKTTTIGKIAHKFQRSGHSVLLVAADTFRAAAVAQLKIWGERNNIQVMAQQDGTDPSAVAFDAMAYAQSRQYDVVLVDTAGRLHTQSNLMEELKKIKRVMGKKLPGAPHETLLVLDATTGQNAITQARIFHEAVQITGLALTKLDGTAKGGIVINISKELQIPLRFIGVGEQLEDLRDFEPQEFVDALFDSGSYGRNR